MAQRRVDVRRMGFAQALDLGQHRVGQLPARLVPLAACRARVHQRAQLGRDEAVVDEEVFLQRQARVAALQVAGLVALDAVAQRQVLGAGGRAQGVGLHEAAEPVHGGHERRRWEEAAGDRMAAQRGEVDVRRHGAAGGNGARD
jgi:hypothetical protein